MNNLNSINSIKWLMLLLCMFAHPWARAATHTAASCNTSDVQAAINASAEGDTVQVPAGRCTWTSGVVISGKGINLLGAGTSRIIAIGVNQPLTLTTGTQSLTVQGADPGSATIPITVGETLNLQELATEANSLVGTVTSFNASTKQLTMNVTSAAGTCGSNQNSNCERWLISTVPTTSTVIVNNASGSSSPALGGLFQVSEDTSFHTSIGNLQVVPGTTYQDNVIQVNYTSGGQAVLIHDMRITGNPNLNGPANGNMTMIMMNTNRGVIWNCSFDSSPYNIAKLGAISVQDPNLGTSWTTVSNMGSLDTDGQGAVFGEDNDYHAMQYTTSTDDNGRAVWRYSLYDNSGIATHGADTSNFGQRYFEFYDNVGVYEGYEPPADVNASFNFNNWVFLRGGTGLMYNNKLDPLVSQNWGHKPDVEMTVMNLQRNQGPDACWGAGTAAGADYHAPRQVGYGYVTGKGTSPNQGGETHDSISYVGDSEPFYIWGNNGNTPLNVEISNYGGSGCSNPDSSANYIVLNRDYFNGTTAKPGWSPYTYPHPLRGTKSSPGTTPSAPTGLTGTVSHN